VNFQIRLATQSDIGKLSKIAHTAYAKYRARMDRDPAPMHADFATHITNDIVFVAFNEQATVCGFVVLINEQDGWLLDNIAVNPDITRSGIGTKLLRHCEAYLRGLNVVTYQLYTNVVMREALSWYLSLGFVETGRRVEDGFHRVYLERSLNEKE